MSIGKILFSFSGRIPRSTYWLATLGIWFGLFAFAVVIGLLSAVSGGGRRSGDGAMILLVPMYICALWCSLAVTVKRWHDHGKSGAWVLIGLIPFIGPIWSLVELGFLEGTNGPNEYDDGIFSGDYANDPAFSAPPIAGRQCALCQQTIVSFVGAGLCGECQAPTHTDCYRAHMESTHISPAPVAYP